MTGIGASAELGQLLGARPDIESVMIVTTKGLQERGTLNGLVAALEDANVAINIFDEVVPDPGYQIILNGVDRYRDSGAGAVVAVVGGSAIDAAKAIVAGYSNG